MQFSFSSSLKDELLIKKEDFEHTKEELSQVNQKIDEEETYRDSHRVRKSQRDLEKKRSDLLYTKGVLTQSIMQLEKLKFICDKFPAEQINDLTIFFNELSNEYKQMYEQWEDTYDMWKQNEKKQKVSNMKIGYIYDIESDKFKEYNNDLQNAFQGCLKYENECMKIEAVLQSYNDTRRFVFKNIKLLENDSV